MLKRLLQGTEWSEVSSYLSPSFFTVVSPFKMAAKFKTLTKNFMTRDGFEDIAAMLQSRLELSNIPLHIDPKGSPQDSPPKSETKESAATKEKKSTNARRGELLLRLYFTQIMHLPACLLDYRQSRFVAGSGKNLMTWKPTPLFVVWDGLFLDGVRRLYQGFYENDEQVLDAALASLGLDTAKKELLAHFGSRQDKVEFNLATFRSTFHHVFEAAKKGKRSLPADFLPFGAGLACLYEHLEGLGGTFDPRAAYFAAKHDDTAQERSKI
jgi:hypothetical protein